MKKILGMVLVLLAIAGTVGVVRKFSHGDTTTQTGNRAYDRGQKAGKYAVPGVVALMFIYGFRLLFSSDDSGPPPRRNPTGPRLPFGATPVRSRDDTFASNPGRLRPNLLKWFAARPAVIALGMSFLVFGLWMLFRVHPIAGFAVLGAIPLTVFHTIRDARRKFYSGCINPGIVVSAEKGLVAVHTDLIFGGSVPRPVIKVVKQPLGKILGEPAHDGMRVATIALYYPPIRESAWSNFDPEVVNCFVDQEEEIARVLASISEEEWQALDTALPRIPVDRPGLYRLWGGHITQDATPWLKRKPVIVGLSVLCAFAVLAGLMNLLTWQANRARERREATVAVNPQRPGAKPTAPRSYVRSSRTTDETPTAAAPAPPKPTLTSLELNGTVVTVTNISGRIFENIKLVRATPGGVIYTTEGGGGTIPLGSLPPQFLEALGVPSAWVTTAAAASTPTQRASGVMAGARVTARWGGKWVAGTITEVRPGGHVVMVKLEDSRSRSAIPLSTNQIRLP